MSNMEVTCAWGALPKKTKPPTTDQPTTMEPSVSPQTPSKTLDTVTEQPEEQPNDIDDYNEPVAPPVTTKTIVVKTDRPVKKKKLLSLPGVSIAWFSGKGGQQKALDYIANSKLDCKLFKRGLYEFGPVPDIDQFVDVYAKNYRDGYAFSEIMRGPKLRLILDIEHYFN